MFRCTDFVSRGHYDGRNKTFWMFSAETNSSPGLRTDQARMPTALEQVGNFSQRLAPSGRPLIVYDPLTSTTGANGVVTRQPFQNAIIPRERLDATATAVLNRYPQPNLNVPNTVGINNWAGQTSNVVEETNWSVRGDHNFTRR